MCYLGLNTILIIKFGSERYFWVLSKIKLLFNRWRMNSLIENTQKNMELDKGNLKRGIPKTF